MSVSELITVDPEATVNSQCHITTVFCVVTDASCNKTSRRLVSCLSSSKTASALAHHDHIVSILLQRGTPLTSSVLNFGRLTAHTCNPIDYKI